MNRLASLLTFSSFKVLNQRQCLGTIQIYQNFPVLLFSSSTTQGKSTDEAAAEKKKKKLIPRITLISEGDKVEISTLEEAQKLASRRNLKLVKIVDLDTKSQRPIYKLMTGQEYLSEELKQRKDKKSSKKGGLKGEKLLSVSTRIASHDLQAKAKLASKWIQKNYEVRVIITRDGAENTKLDQISKEIEKITEKDGRIVQKRVSNNDIRFSVLPLKKQEDDYSTGTPPDSSKPKNDPETSLENPNKTQIRSYHTDSS